MTRNEIRSDKLDRSNILDDWPYATSYLLRTLEPDLIESHAVSILSRALNVGRVVAFVGAGTSMSYGRISWGGLVAAQIADVNDKYRDYCKRTKRPQNPDANSKQEAAHINIWKLRNTIAGLTKDRDVKPERNPLLFQLCEQLEQAMRAELSRLQKDQKSEGAQTTTNIRTETQRLLLDDVGHAHQILIDGLKSSIDNEDKIDRAVRTAISKLNDSDLHPRYIFTAGKITGLATRVARQDRRFSKIAEIIARQFKRRNNLEYVLPIDRYLTGALLAALPDSARSRAFKFLIHEKKSGLKAENAPSRHEIVAIERDPLLLLYDRLKISRFITTNYDHEIEEMLKDQGLWQRPGGTTEHTAEASPDLSSPSFDVTIFKRNKATDLLAFAVRDRSASAGVVHLHGRAESDPSKGEIIVTERDYQLQYAVLDETRDLVDASIRSAFAASPVLFVGSNMGEDDILRPLRQFMGAPDQLGDRVAVAFLPQLGTDQDINEEKIALLGRHGVYAIHFGKASFKPVDDLDKRVGRSNADERAKRLQESVNWLPWIWQLKKFLTGLFKLCGATKPADREDLRKRVGEIRGMLKESRNWLKRKRLISPATIELISIQEKDSRAHPDVSLEVELLNAIVNALSGFETVIARKGPPKVKFAEPKQLAARAFAAMLQGLGDSLLAAFTCARLQRAVWEWEIWKEEWYRRPKPRPVWLEKTPPPDQMRKSKGNPPVLVRWHRIGLPPGRSPSEKPGRSSSGNQYRFVDSAPSQALNGLLSALGNSAKDNSQKENKTFLEERRRRILVLLARRGIGKGHFFAMLGGQFPETGSAARRRVDLLLDALNGRDSTVKYAARILLNLSFTHEIMSAFDRVIDVMATALEMSVATSRRDEIKRAHERLANDRLGRLGYTLNEWAKLEKLRTEGKLPAAEYQPNRVFIAINNCGVLFDRQGQPKNGQVKHIFDLLSGCSFEDVPLDLVLLTDPERTPAQLCISTAHRLIRSQIDERREKQVREILDRVLTGRPASKPPDPNETVPTASAATPNIAFHVLHETRATILAATFFPRIAFLLSRHALIKCGVSAAEAYPAVFAKHEADIPRKVVRDILEVIEQKTSSRLSAGRTIPVCFAWLALKVEDGEARLDIEFEKLRSFIESPELDKLTGYPSIEDIAESLHRYRGRAGKNSKLNSRPGRVKARITPESIVDIAKAFDGRMRRLFIALGRSRYALTLALAGAHELTADLTKVCKSRPSSNDIILQAVNDATESVSDFLEQLEQRLYSAAPERRFDIVLKEYLALLNRRHDQGLELPIPVKLGVNKAGKWIAAPRATRQQHRLMMEVLRHVALVGQPVHAVCLEYCPAVRKAALSLRSEIGRKNGNIDKDVKDIVLEILKLLEHRCLIMQVEPMQEPDENDRRYVVHSLVQREVFQKMGGPDVESNEADQFTLSFYATQPSDLPQLSDEAHADITTTIEQLIGYPDPSGWFHAYATLSPAKRTRLLRGAFGIVRSIYSFGVLARFEQLGEVNENDPLLGGHFERYRRMLRWMLRSALAMEKEELARKSGRKTRAAVDRKDRFAPPFYAEELVWLYNECGVLSLIQGRLADAYALFDTACEMVKEHIEPTTPGPLTVRIHLNMAIVDIERGALKEARQKLEPIAKLDTNHEHPVPPLLAKGYLALIRHLRGDFATADKDYAKVIKELRRLGRTRAVSIFIRHRADLKRAESTSKGLKGLLESRALAEEALTVAREGGHADIVQHAQLAIAKSKLESDKLEERAEVHRILERIDRYARIVGMPRLTSEVADVRARMLRAQGESRLAVRVAVDGVNVAAIHDLKLRKVSSGGTLAEVVVDWGLVREALPLITGNLRLAKAAGHMLAQSRLEQMLERYAPLTSTD